MGLFDQFPYTNFHELNLDWILQALKELEHTIDQFVSINALKYADPIQWDITSQYEKNTIVIDPQTGTAYISAQPVPIGVSLTNPDYWTVVFDLGSFVVRAATNLANTYEADTTLTATVNTLAGGWLVWGDTLYKAMVNITAGDSYVVNSNIEHFTIEELTGHLEDLSTTDKSNIVAAINEVASGLAAEVLARETAEGDLNDLVTTDKSNLVAAINEVAAEVLGKIGDLDDLNTTDKSNLVAAINEVADNIGESIEPLIVPYIEGTFEDVEVGKFIYTHGYYSAYDGGGGFYERVSSPIINITYDHNGAYYRPIAVNGFVNVKQFGVKGGFNDDTTVWASNKATIEAVIAASIYEGLIIPSDVNYGYDAHATSRNVLDLSTSTIKLLIYDYSNDDSYYPSQPETIKAAVCRILMHTPDADGDGKHDGNGLHIIGNTNPYLALVNDGTTGAETRRAGIFWGSRDYTDYNHVYNWQMSQGYLVTDKDLHINKLYYDEDLGAVTSYNYITFRYDKANNTHNMVFGNTNAAYFPFHLQGIHPAVVQDNSVDNNLFEYFDKYPNPTMRINFQYRTTKEMRINNEIGAQVILDFSNTDANKISTMFKYGVGGGAYATSQRPASTLVKIGAMIFDTTLNKPIWFNGTNWVDATGTTV